MAVKTEAEKVARLNRGLPHITSHVGMVAGGGMTGPAFTRKDSAPGKGVKATYSVKG